jgi:hypothetical protein
MAYEIRARTAKGEILLCTVATREQAASLVGPLAQVLGCRGQ